MSSPQTYKYIEAPKVPKLIEAYSAKVRENFNWVSSSIASIITALSNLGTALAGKAPTANPDFSGRIGVPTLTADPGDPPVGQAWMFVLVDPGTSSDLIVRHNDGGTVRTASISLT